MLAPTDAKAVVRAGDDDIVLRLNFRSIALAEAEGIDLLSGDQVTDLPRSKALVLLKCLAAEDQPWFTENHALTVARSAPEELSTALTHLFARFGGMSEPEDGAGNAAGNGSGRKPRRD